MRTICDSALASAIRTGALLIALSIVVQAASINTFSTGDTLPETITRILVAFGTKGGNLLVTNVTGFGPYGGDLLVSVSGSDNGGGNAGNAN
jgi:hypothetical protein